MGDNVYLGDRDGVRTPMQWTGDRNGGFSRADFAQLYLPPLMDPVYGYQAVNVEAQLRTPDLAPALAAALHRAAQASIPSSGSAATRRCAQQPADLRPHPPLRGRHRALRPQPRPLRAGSRARPVGVRGPGPGRDVRPDALPAHRRAAVPADARTERVLLVPAREDPGRADEAPSERSALKRPSARPSAIPSDELAGWLVAQRWFGAKSRELRAVQRGRRRSRRGPPCWRCSSRRAAHRRARALPAAARHVRAGAGDAVTSSTTRRLRCAAGPRPGARLAR